MKKNIQVFQAAIIKNEYFGYCINKMAKVTTIYISITIETNVMLTQQQLLTTTNKSTATTTKKKKKQKKKKKGN